MTLTRKNFEELGLPVGPYTHVVKHGDTLFTSGFTAFGTERRTGSASEQTHAVLEQLEFIAAQFGRTLADLIKVTVFMTDPADIPGIRNALSTGYKDAVPASSLVMVSGLFAPELKVEIEAIIAV
ncbi:RidA family protein [uncultured Roseibium sp.]|uniref:RidA family protein n=1 Tax=uncultured Roseibium sp. TaxID=1936171 RepID=UPI002601F83C|nr:RidA family protein [uncultured Roseibium sp.]